MSLVAFMRLGYHKRSRRYELSVNIKIAIADEIDVL